LLLVPAAVTHRVYAQAAPSAESGQQTTPEAQAPEKEKQEEDENAAYRHSDTVKWLGSKLGLNVDQAASVFEILNFVILLGAIGFALIKALPKLFRKRSTEIQKELVDARTATEEARARLSSVEERLSKLDGQIAGMQSQAEQDAVAEEARTRAAIEEERKKILAAAEQEIASATVNARRQIQQYAAELAIEQAARKLVVTAETDRLLVQAFAQRLGDSKGGQN
jgi:F-type H+-transporting ATPase subunit b